MYACVLLCGRTVYHLGNRHESGVAYEFIIDQCKGLDCNISLMTQG